MTIIEETQTIEFHDPLLDAFEASTVPQLPAERIQRRMGVATAAIAVAIALALGMFFVELLEPGRTTAELPIVSQAEQVPSGSSFDAPLQGRSGYTDQVPSGSPFDRPLQPGPVTAAE